MSMQSTNHNDKINKALHLLSEAAEEKKYELTENISRLKEKAGEVIHESGVKIQQTATNVDKTVRKNPWPYIGGVALGALLTGFFLGKIKKK